jgi:hypothetical protein
MESRGQAHVARVSSNSYLTVARGVRLTCKQPPPRWSAPRVEKISDP